MLARIVPGVIPPTIGTATLTEVAPTAFADPYSYSYTVTVAITINGQAPPTSFGWRAYVSAGSTNTAFPFSASSFTNLNQGVNNVTFALNGNALASYYLRVEVVTSDSFGNIAVVQGTSNIVQMPSRKKLFGRTYWNTETSFTHPSGPTTYDVFFTSKGGNGSGEIPGAQTWGGGGAGVRINGLTPDGDTYYVDNRVSEASCYLRKGSAGNTSDQIFADNGGNATVSPYNDGIGASAATLTGFFTGGTLVVNAAGQTGSTGGGFGSATELGGRSGIHTGNNPPYLGQSLGVSGGLTGLVDLDADGFADVAVFDAAAFGCGGYGVNFPDGFVTFGQGQSGNVFILYYE